MNWEEKEKKAMQNRLEGSEKTPTEIIEKELRFDFFNFNGTDSLHHKIGNKRISVNCNANQNQHNSVESSALELHSFDDEFNEPMLDTFHKLA